MGLHQTGWQTSEPTSCTPPTWHFQFADLSKSGLTMREILSNVVYVRNGRHAAIISAGILERRPADGRGHSERSERSMPETDHNNEQTVRDRAYFIWEREGRPQGRAHDHWYRATREAFRLARAADDESMLDEEKIMAGHIDVNMPALLTKDVPGG